MRRRRISSRKSTRRTKRRRVNRRTKKSYSNNNIFRCTRIGGWLDPSGNVNFGNYLFSPTSNSEFNMTFSMRAAVYNTTLSSTIVNSFEQYRIKKVKVMYKYLGPTLTQTTPTLTNTDYGRVFTATDYDSNNSIAQKIRNYTGCVEHVANRNFTYTIRPKISRIVYSVTGTSPFNVAAEVAKSPWIDASFQDVQYFGIRNWCNGDALDTLASSYSIDVKYWLEFRGITN